MNNHALIVAFATLLPIGALAGGIGGTLEEPVVIAPMPLSSDVDGWSWTGSYAGITLGYGTGSSTGDDQRHSSPGAALHLGYHRDYGNWVAGVEADMTGIARRNVDSGNTELGIAGRLKLRGGPKFGEDGRSFVFGTVGGAVARTRSASGSATDTGWLAGFGAAHSISDNLFVAGELSYHRFGNVVNTSDDVTATVLSTALSFRF